MTIAIKSSDVSSTVGQSVQAGQTGSFAASAVFSFTAGTTAFAITAKDIVGSSADDYSLTYTLATLTGDSTSITLSAQSIDFTIVFDNDNTPETLTGDAVSAVFTTGSYATTGDAAQSNGVQYSTATFMVSGLGGYVGLDGTGNRVWTSKAEKTRMWNQGF